MPSLQAHMWGYGAWRSMWILKGPVISLMTRMLRHSSSMSSQNGLDMCASFWARSSISILYCYEHRAASLIHYPVVFYASIVIGPELDNPYGQCMDVESNGFIILARTTV